MPKHILVISTSPRKGGNSETLANEFIRGAEESGNHVEKICLYDKTISFCKGCLTCLKTRTCIIHDDAEIIAQKMKTADVLVFATPVYYYEMSGQMKTMLDRANPLYDSDYQFRDVYLLAAAAEDEDTAVEGPYTDFPVGLPASPNPVWQESYSAAALVQLVKLQEIQLLKRPMKWEKQSAKIYGIYIEKWMPQSPGGILFFLYSGIYANPDILPFPHRWYTSPFLS